MHDDLALLLAREARRHDTSVSEVVRRAVAAFLGVSSGERRELPFAALGRSGRKHTARDAEEILTRSGDMLAVVDTGPL